MERDRLTDRARSALAPAEVALRIAALDAGARAVFVAIVPVLATLGGDMSDPYPQMGSRWWMFVSATVQLGLVRILWGPAIDWLRRLLATLRPAEVRAREAPAVAAALAVTAVLVAVGAIRDLANGLGARLAPNANGLGRDLWVAGLDGDPAWMIAPGLRTLLAVAILLNLRGLTVAWTRCNRRR